MSGRGDLKRAASLLAQRAFAAQHDDAVHPGEWMTEHHNSQYHDEPNRCHIAEDRKGHYWTVASEVYIPIAEHMAALDPAFACRLSAMFELESRRWFPRRHVVATARDYLRSAA